MTEVTARIGATAPGPQCASHWRAASSIGSKRNGDTRGRLAQGHDDAPGGAACAERLGSRRMDAPATLGVRPEERAHDVGRPDADAAPQAPSSRAARASGVPRSIGGTDSATVG